MYKKIILIFLILLCLALLTVSFFAIKAHISLKRADNLDYALINGKKYDITKSEIRNGCGNIWSGDKLIKVPPENIPLKILYEDENMLVVYKPAGMNTHPTLPVLNDSLVNALVYKYGENLSTNQGELCRGIVHRLDKNTSGILMVAKNNKAHEYLEEKIMKHEMDKHYYAITKGVIKEDEFVINKPIGKDPFVNFKMTVRPDGKKSITEVKVLERYKNSTLVDVHLITGRKHQIRVHLSSIGHPLYNDTMYGFGKKETDSKEQALMSYKLSFPRPFDGKIITVQIPQDEEFTKVLEYVKSQEDK